jgi:serine/threonine protein kinase
VSFSEWSAAYFQQQERKVSTHMKTAPPANSAKLYSTLNRTYVIHKDDEEVKWTKVPYRYKEFYKQVVNAFNVGAFEKHDMNLFYNNDENQRKPLTCDLDLVCIDHLASKCVHVYAEIPPMHPDDAELRYHSDLGQGSYGVVKLCINQKGEPVAMKQIRLRQSAVGLQDVLQEIQTLERLQHPSIVKYLGTRRDEDNFYILLEYVPMGSLKKVLEKMKRFTEEGIASYMRQVLRALSYLHSQGVIHRDIKCDNVLLDSDGKIKLADFGCAKVLEIQKRTADERQSSVVAGTLAYLSPEILNGKEPTFACDIWALGCMAVELFTGKMAWEDHIRQQNWSREETANKLKDYIKSEHTPPYPTDTNEISPSFLNFLQSCFELDPQKRPTVDTLLKHPFIANEGRTDEQPPTDDAPSSPTDYSSTLGRLRKSSSVTDSPPQEVLFATEGFESANFPHDFTFVTSVQSTKVSLYYYKDETVVTINKIPLKDILECKLVQYINLLRRIEDAHLQKIARTYCVIKSESYLHVIQEAFDLDWDNLQKQMGDQMADCAIPQLIIALNELHSIGFSCIFLSQNFIEFTEDGNQLKLKNIGVERILQAHTMIENSLEKGLICAPEVLECRYCNPDSYLVGHTYYSLLAPQNNKKIPRHIRFDNIRLSKLIDETYRISNDPLLKQFLMQILLYCPMTEDTTTTTNRPTLSDLIQHEYVRVKSENSHWWKQLLL